jgi:hypothetical protein
VTLRAPGRPPQQGCRAGRGDQGSHRYRPIASFTQSTLALETSRSIVSSAFSLRSRASTTDQNGRDLDAADPRVDGTIDRSASLAAGP